MVTIAAYDDRTNKRKMAEFYLLKGNALVAMKNYEEAILYYKYGSTIAEELLGKEYTIHNCKLVASYRFFTADYYEHIGEYESAYAKFLEIPHYISEWSNQFSDTEVSWLLASGYAKAANYYFYRLSNYEVKCMREEALTKCSYSVELFLSIVRKALSEGICNGLLEASITKGVLHLLEGERNEAADSFAEAKRALKKCEMLQRLAGKEETLFGKWQLLQTLESRLREGSSYSNQKLFLLYHNYLFGKDTRKHKNCIP